jgi:hypothetical protein
MSAVPDMQQVHEWFLRRGLPLVLTRRVRSRDLIDRSAPMVSGVGALTGVTMLLAEVTGADPAPKRNATGRRGAPQHRPLGFGWIALWAFRFAWVQFGALGSLMGRALPLLMLTLLVFLSGRDAYLEIEGSTVAGEAI